MRKRSTYNLATFVKLAKVRSFFKFLYKKTIENVSHCQQKKSHFQRNIFGGVVKTEFYLFRKTFWVKKNFEAISDWIDLFRTSSTNFWDFGRKYFGRVVKTVFQVSTGTVWRNLFLEKTIDLYTFSDFEQKVFNRILKNCIPLGHRNVLQKEKIQKKLSIYNFFQLWLKNFWTFSLNFSSELSNCFLRVHRNVLGIFRKTWTCSLRIDRLRRKNQPNGNLLLS